MATSAPLWAILVCHCTHNWGVWVLQTELPNYVDSILGVDITQVGYLPNYESTYLDWTTREIYEYSLDERGMCELVRRGRTVSVSYTHLTLPTIYSV